MFVYNDGYLTHNELLLLAFITETHSNVIYLYSVDNGSGILEFCIIA
jgi:hypothetical protein